MSEKKTRAEINREREALLNSFVEKEEGQETATRDQSLSVAERMMRRAESKTFTLGFLDEKNDDEIEIEFRLLYTQERRNLIELINKVQTLQGNEEVDLAKFNDVLDSLKGIVKKTTVTEGMDVYYDSEKCQDGDIFEIAKAVMMRTVGTLEDAKSFRQE